MKALDAILLSKLVSQEPSKRRVYGFTCRQTRSAELSINDYAWKREDTVVFFSFKFSVVEVIKAVNQMSARQEEKVYLHFTAHFLFCSFDGILNFYLRLSYSSSSGRTAEV